MNKWPLIAALAAAPVFAQDFDQPPAPPAPPAPAAVAVPAAPAALPAPFEMDLDRLRGMSDQARALADQARMGADVARAKGAVLFAQQGGIPSPASKGQTFRVYSSGQYDSGTRLLDEHKYDEAVRQFDHVIQSKSDRSDGALYWKAYALNRLGRRDESLATIATLRHDYASSHWLNDAQVLEAEVKQSAGKPVSPADESNEEIKLMAINSLMRADPERAVPLLEGLLKSGSSPRLKDRALFVLTQNRSPKAEQILAEYAKGAGNPDLQLRAIRYIGVSGTAESAQQLLAIYASTNDKAVKREILRQMVGMKYSDQLVRLYASETMPEVKTEIIRSLMASGAGDRIIEIARTEKDPALRVEAIRNLVGVKGNSDALVGLYGSDMDAKTKREVVNTIFARGDAKGLVELARKESDPQMKLTIVERLGSMRNNKEATDYMMEILK